MMQIITDTEKRTLDTPERKLLVAMIERAVFDYFGNQASDKAEAAEWLFGDLSDDDAFSFSWVCNQLDIDSEGVLTRLRRMRPRKGMSTQQWWALNCSNN